MLESLSLILPDVTEQGVFTAESWIIKTKAQINRKKVMEPVMTGRGENVVINTNSMKFQLCSGWLKKDLIDLAGISGYNGIEVIYLWGMAFAFPTYIQKEVYGCGHRNKKCCECGGQRRTIR